MFENINIINLKILSLYMKDYSSEFSIRDITKRLNINYSNTFKRIKELIKEDILREKRMGKSKVISLNIFNIDTISLLSFVEERASKSVKNSTLKLMVNEALLIDPFACMGLFGSRVSGRATKDSDWDIFIITQKRGEMEKIMAKFPYVTNIQLQVFTSEEFENSLLSAEETVVKHIVKNKQIIYNPHPFYNIIYKWEKIRYAPRQIR
jgi:predicted nucleotidyltransferase